MMPSESQQAPKGSIGSLLRHSATYSLVPIFGNVISIVMIAFFTNWLHKEEMGLNDSIDLFLAFSLEFLGVSALQGMVRFYFEHKKQRDRYAVVSSSIMFGACVSWIVCGMCWVFSDILRPILLAAETSNISKEYLNEVFALAMLLVPFQMTTQAGFGFLMIQHRSGLFAGISAGKMLAELALKIWFVAPAEVLPFGLGMGVKGILLSVFISEATVGTVLALWILNVIGWRFEWSKLKPVVAYSTPLIMASLFHLALQRLDIRMIEILLGTAGLGAVGIYGIGYRVGRLANQLMLGPFLQVFLPWVYEVEDEHEQTNLISRVTTYLLVAVGAADIALSCFGREAILLLDRSDEQTYRFAYQVVPLAAGSYLFWAIYKAIGETSFYVAKKTSALSWLSLVALLVNIGLNLWLIPEYGIVGAAIATLVAYAALAILGEIGRYRIFKYSMDYRRIGSCLAAVGIASAAALTIDNTMTVAGEFSMKAMLIKIPIALVGTLFMWQFVLLKSERTEFFAWVRGRLGRES